MSSDSVCVIEEVSTIRDKTKLVLDGFGYVNDNTYNGRSGVRYYWHCDQLLTEVGCKGRIITNIVDEKHKLVKLTVPHGGHGRNPSKAMVLKKIQAIRERAKSSNDKPCDIIRTNEVGMSQCKSNSMPSNE